jgi:parvulin-like peptidyl-prolyl isomerase
MPNTPPTSRRVRSAHESRSATVRAAAAAPSRRQQSRWRREQNQQRTLYIAIGTLAALVLVIFAGGLLYDNVIRANQTVAQIGSDSVTASQLLDEIRPQVRALDAQAKQLGGGTNIQNYVDQQKRSMPDSVLNQLVDQHLIQQEADRRGISVSASELDDKEHQTVADFQAANNPTPTPEASPTTDTGATPASGAGAQTSATPAPTAAGTPTAVPTLDSSAYTPALQQLLDKNSLKEADLRKQLQQNMLRDKVQTALGSEQVPDQQDQVHARQIVVATQDQANALLTQLQGGADFAQLAQQNSTDTATTNAGGDMGWFSRGVQTSVVDNAVFALQPGQLSDVVQDTSGFHILQLLEHDPARQVPAAQLTTQRSKAFNDWLSGQRSSPSVKLSLDQGEKDWILARLGIHP